jgi:hypothetical protein
MKICRLSIIAIGFCLLFNITSGIAAEVKKEKKSPFITHGEFITDLVTAMGWDAGLPPKPRDVDYLNILSGNRSFKFEAEKYYAAQTDNVSVRKYELFGPFSGSGWVSGISVPTTAHFKILLPLGGTYSMTVAAKGDGQKWLVGGKEFTVSTGSKIAEKVIADVKLEAGYQEIQVVIPADGAVDYFMLDAPPLRPVAPLNGWNAKSLMNHGELAEVTAALLPLENDLPDDGKPAVVTVADVSELPSTAKVTSVNYLGKSLTGKWVRAGYSGAKLEIPFKADREAIYRIRIRALGDTISAQVDDFKVIRNGKPYLDWIDLGFFRLDQGGHKLEVSLGNYQGLDAVEISGKKSSSADYMTVSAVQGAPDAPVKRSELDKILASLVERFKERK